MELTGMIIAVLPAQSGVSARTGNAWMSQEYVLEVPAQYPRRCCFKVFGEDRIKQFNIKQGETLTVQFDIDSHEYNGRWFNEIRAFNVIKGQSQVQGQAQQTQQATESPQPAQQTAQPSLFPPEQQQQDNSDDLPF